MLKNAANARFLELIFVAPFPTLALFLAPNHDSSTITIIILAIHPSPITIFSPTAHAQSIKIVENRPHKLRTVAT